jgi:tetratricopeptide (TPR) repeat protein
LNRLILAYWAAGYQPNRTKALAVVAERLAKDSGHLEDRLNIRSNLGLWYLDAGRFDEAARCINSAMKILPAPENAQMRVLEINHSILALRTGDFRAAQNWCARLVDRPDSPRKSLNAMRDAIAIFVALEGGRLDHAMRLGERLRQVDLSFPFDSNLSIVPESLAELERRVGRKAAGREILATAAETMGRFNVPCRAQILRRLRTRTWTED